jgi:hypothetical protein
MITGNRPIHRREYGYLAFLTSLCVVATGFPIMMWYAAGMDRLLLFHREYEAFCRSAAAEPAFRNVAISYTDRKGARVYLHGSVASKDSHDRLITTIEQMIRNNDGGYYDGVEFPGRPKMD